MCLRWYSIHKVGWVSDSNVLSWYHIQLCVLGIRFKCAGFGTEFKKVGWVLDSNVFSQYHIQLCVLCIRIKCACFGTAFKRFAMFNMLAQY